MLKTFKYRLYPTKSQKTILTKQLEECRWLYNHFLEERKTTYDKLNKSPSMYDQMKTIPVLKTTRESLSEVYSQVLQNVAVRIDLAFKAFFRRVKAGEKPGYPRFRNYNRYHSMTFSQPPAGCNIYNGVLELFKVGRVKIILDRQCEGKIKSCAVCRASTGKWYVCFSCEITEQRSLKANKNKIGIDVGLTSFVTLSNGEKVDNPRFFSDSEKKLAKAQRKLSKIEETSNKLKQKKVIALIHEQIANRRKDFIFQIVNKLIHRFGFIAIEDLEVNRMIHKNCLAKSIHDVAWSMFFNILFFKAASAGRTIVKVNPAYTSQTCSKCGHRQKMPLSKRMFNCPCCKLKLNRDHNAALNILKIGLGQQAIGSNP